MTHSHAEAARAPNTERRAVPHGGACDDVCSLEIRPQQVWPPSHVARVEGAARRRLEKIERDYVVSVVVGVKGIAQSHLVEVADALDGLGLLFRSRQRRQQQARQDGDDGNHHQQLDKSKTAATVWLE